MATAGDRRGPGPERAFVDPLPVEGEVVLDAAESGHLVKSRRARAGDAVVLFDGRGGSALARVEDADPRRARLVIESAYPDREPSRHVVLAVSPPEGGRMDTIVAMAAELGVSVLVPLVAERTPAGRGEQAVRRAGRWARLAREAAKVNGRSRVLEVGPPSLFAAFLGQPWGGVTVVLEPDPVAQPLSMSTQTADRVRVVIGPEGGFTAEEIEWAKSTGAQLARLGSTALRTETAAVAAAAVVLASSAAR